MVISLSDPAPGNKVNSATNVGGLLLQPWWIGLICLIVVLMFIFITIVICVHRHESRKEQALIHKPDLESENAIY